MILMGYAQSSFGDFKSHLRIVVGLDEDDNQQILKQNISYFFICEKPPGFCFIKDLLETIYTMGNDEETLQIEYDDFSMKTKII